MGVRGNRVWCAWAVPTWRPTLHDPMRRASDGIAPAQSGAGVLASGRMFGPVAIVHDWMTSMRGGERVLECLCGLFPQADVFTLRCEPRRLSPSLASRQVTTSFIDRVARAPFVRGRFRALLPLFPLAVEAFRLDRYPLVIS